MLTKEKIEQVLGNLGTVHDSVKWKDNDNFMSCWCEVTFRANKHNTVLAFSFDEDGNMIPSMTGGPTLSQLVEYNAVYSRALAVITLLELKQL